MQCHLSQAAADSIVLHLSPHDGKPYALDYFVSPVPRDGACPATSKSSVADFAFRPFANTTVSVRLPTAPPA